MTDAKLESSIGRLTLMRFFPTSAYALQALVEIFTELCRNDQEAERLTTEMLAGFDQWPGPLALRRCYWTKVADGKGCGACYGHSGWVYIGENICPCTCGRGRKERALITLGISVARPWFPNPEWRKEAQV
jgi:hypothetical protein